MDKKEKHVKENEREDKRLNEIAESLPAEGRVHKRRDSGKSNRLWLWLGVLVLVFILIYWLFSIGILGDMTDYFNG